MNSTAYRIRVAIVDDHPLMCEGVRCALGLAQDIAIVGEAHSGAEARRLLHDVEADVVLLDCRLPDVNGVELLREFVGHDSSPQFVMLTHVTGYECVRSAIDAGASAFLSKRQADPSTLATAVRNAHNDVNTLSDDALSSLLSTMRGSTGRAHQDLTPREREVWRLLSEGKTNPEIARELFISERTVKFHVGNVLQKTGARSRAEATSLAYRSGLLDWAE